MSIWSKAEILCLSIPERIQLVEDVWESIVEAPQELPLTKAQAVELDRRLDAYRENPKAGSTWDEVRKRIEFPE